MKPSIELDLQTASSQANLPSQADVELWVKTTLNAAAFQGPDGIPVELCVRLVDEPESQQLNATYRNRDNPTNVLSFPYSGFEEIPLALLGDLVICAPVVAREAIQQQKSLTAHWAHMVTHGVLHLLGYDHVEMEQAKVMEALEVRILDQLGYADPYVINNPL